MKVGGILIKGSEGREMVLWVDVKKPVIHMEASADVSIEVFASYESWRHYKVEGAAYNANSYKWALPEEVITYADSIHIEDSGVLFYHHNREETVFDHTVALQKLVVSSSLYSGLSGIPVINGVM